MKDLHATLHLEHERLKETHGYCADVLATLREPFLVLGADLVVRSANRAFYTSFHTTRAETEGHRVGEVADGQWNSPALRSMLEGVIKEGRSFQDFAIENDAAGAGSRPMVINAQRVYREGGHSELILVGIEDVTTRNLAQKLLKNSELRYRRLFEAAEDAILIL
ncbi:MAG: PAS domain-containing protein, partial [Thermoanaerobaculia bacterium]